MTRPAPRPESAPLQLVAGPLSARFEPGSAFLRDIRWHGAPVLMGIYAAVRDCNWGTVNPVLSEVRLTQTATGSTLSFLATCQFDAIDFRWRGRIELGADGWVRYDFAGEAHSAFARNRIGFCIVHSAANCAGQTCRVRHPAGDWTEGRFPERISPHQPFRDIQTIAWQAANGTECTVECEGDVFEMEDQRNWSDASFKTYCTPLARPFPVPVAPGDEVRQSVVLRLGQPTHRRSARPSTHPGKIGYPAVQRPLPRIAHGLGEGALGSQDLERLRALIRPAAVRHTVDFAAANWLDRLRLAEATAQSLGAELDLALIVDDTKVGLAALRDWAKSSASTLGHCLVLSANSPCTRSEDLAAARQALPSVRLGVGTRGNFAELNRGRPVPNGADFVAYALATTVHAHDRQTILENIGAAAWTVRDARALYPKLAVEVGPVAFRQQYNPVATALGSSLPPDCVPEHVDVRQSSLFGAAYGLGIFAALAESGATGTCLFDLVGMTGLMEASDAPVRPAPFVSSPGCVYPLFHVVADLRELAGGTIGSGAVAGHPEVPAVLGITAAERRWLVANPYPEPVTLELPETAGTRHYRLLSAATAAEAATDPHGFRSANRLQPLTANRLELPPEAYLCVAERKGAR